MPEGFLLDPVVFLRSSQSFEFARTWMKLNCPLFWLSAWVAFDLKVASFVLYCGKLSYVVGSCSVLSLNWVPGGLPAACS